MKKALSFILIVAMLVSMAALASCGEKDKETNTTTSAADATTTAANVDTTAAEADTTATEDTEPAGGVLKMATNAEFPPYEYHDGDAIVGIDAEIAAKIAEKLGMTLEIADIEFDSIITGVQTGKYDMGMAGMTVTEDRLKNVDFSTSYATGIQVVIVKEDSDIKSLEDLDNDQYLIGVQQSTTGDIYASDDYGETRVKQYNTGADAVAALVSGKVQCVIIDNEPAKAYVKANEGLKILETEYTVEEYAICFAKENADLKEKVDNALKDLIADGTVKSIIDKYIAA